MTCSSRMAVVAEAREGSRAEMVEDYLAVDIVALVGNRSLPDSGGSPAVAGTGAAVGL